MVRTRQCIGQTDLNFSGGRRAATPADIDELVDMLKRCALEVQNVRLPNGKPHSGWFTALELAERLGGDWSDRKVRRVASAAAPGVVGYPGSPGYKLFGACTVEEAHHTVAAFRKQSKEMDARAFLYEDAIRRRFQG